MNCKKKHGNLLPTMKAKWNSYHSILRKNHRSLIHPLPNLDSQQPALTLQEFDYYEFFAGTGNLTRCAQASGYHAVRFDILDNETPGHRKTNFMDLNSVSGFAFLASQSPRLIK